MMFEEEQMNYMSWELLNSSFKIKFCFEFSPIILFALYLNTSLKIYRPIL